MRTTLFAGAGLSRAISERVQYYNNEKLLMPMAYDMFDNISAKDYLSAVEGNFRNAYGALSDYLNIRHKNRTPHKSYETVYSELLQKQEKQAAEQLEGMIFEHLGGNFPPLRYDMEVIQTIRVIRSFLATHQITNIISTNPDILLEVALAGATEFNHEFVKKLGINNIKIVPKFPQGKPVLSINDGLPQLISINKLIKLHGSLLLLKSGSQNEYLWPDRYIWEFGSAHAKYKKEGYKLCVIPPASEKQIHYNEEPYKTMLDETKKILSQSEEVIFFGFGFSLENDKNLSDALKNVSSNLEKVIVYDINAQVSDTQFRNRVIEFLNVKQTKVEFRTSVL